MSQTSMTTLSNLKPGDDITITGGGTMRTLQIRKVVRVLKTYLEDSRGNKWDFKGRKVPREKNIWSQSFAQPTVDAHRAEISRDRLLDTFQRLVDTRCRGSGARQLSVEQLEAIIAILEASPTKTES